MKKEGGGGIRARKKSKGQKKRGVLHRISHLVRQLGCRFIGKKGKDKNLKSKTDSLLVQKERKKEKGKKNQKKGRGPLNGQLGKGGPKSVRQLNNSRRQDVNLESACGGEKVKTKNRGSSYRKKKTRPPAKKIQHVTTPSPEEENLFGQKKGDKFVMSFYVGLERTEKIKKK